MKNITLRNLCLAALFPLSNTAMADQISLSVAESDAQQHAVIAPEIYGQFAEHLGSCIYGGLWVGPDSKIPNVDGYRANVVAPAAFKGAKVTKQGLSVKIPARSIVVVEVE